MSTLASRFRSACWWRCWAFCSRLSRASSISSRACSAPHPPQRPGAYLCRGTILRGQVASMSHLTNIHTLPLQMSRHGPAIVLGPRLYHTLKNVFLAQPKVHNTPGHIERNLHAVHWSQ